MENVPDTVAMLDRDGRILFINRVRLGPEPVIGKSAFDWVPPDSHAALRASLEEVFRAGKAGRFETKVFGRLTAWQNWIFNRPNASGPDGALRRFGTGQRGAYDHKRV